MWGAEELVEAREADSEDEGNKGVRTNGDGDSGGGLPGVRKSVS